MAANRIALVTGAGRRIGREIALGLGRGGYAVGVHHSASADDAAAVVAEIRAAGGEAVALRADLRDPQALAALIPQCSERLGAPVCLVNNASVFFDDRVGHLDTARFDEQMAVNLRAPVFLAQSFAEHLPAGCDGNIINIVDQRVWRPTPQYFSYSVAKAGLWAATRTMAQALAPRIRVNAVGPGPVLKNVMQTDADFAAEAAATILGRGTSPAEIAAAIRFILDAPAMTGQMIALDGGQHLGWRTPDIIGEP